MSIAGLACGSVIGLLWKASATVKVAPADSPSSYASLTVSCRMDSKTLWSTRVSSWRSLSSDELQYVASYGDVFKSGLSMNIKLFNKMSTQIYTHVWTYIMEIASLPVLLSLYTQCIGLSILHILYS